MYDHHLIPYLNAKFGIEVSQSLFGVHRSRFHALVGDKEGTGSTVMLAAMDYAAGYDGELLDTLVTIELGSQS